MMKKHTIYILTSVTLYIFLIMGCQKNKKDESINVEIEVQEIEAYDNLISNNDLMFGLPVRLKYDEDTRHLFILDPDHRGIIEIDDSSNVINKFGRQGHGPGEVQFPTDFYITKEHLFIVDRSRQLIHKYSRRDGQSISSLDFGKFLVKNENLSGSNVLLQPPFMDNDQQPFVTLNETILLPSRANGKFLYQAINWDGDKLADIGEIPTECLAVEDDDKIRSTLANGDIPNRDLCLVFPVNDRSNPDEIYLVYSAIPKIAKYALTGEKIWERQIPHTPEVDSLMIDLSNIVKSPPNRQSAILPVRKYISGSSSPDGELYLFTYTNLHTSTYLRPMWMHQFDSQGTLVNRFRIVSGGVDLYYFPGIDFTNRRIFTSMYRDADIRMYHF